ncbi:hypothetical protein BLNAU_124 [Blattamonas nauphoetae]|uniref:Uncharacterized protein n=1 Tax=Blattamonas nauphoetae TaxID=2049346 RepID=A0ABQ9YM43_9EUKA|nr:hypothetical protein BLNAU_124 [Blattamonas nauphoetae]
MHNVNLKSPQPDIRFIPNKKHFYREDLDEPDGFFNEKSPSHAETKLQPSGNSITLPTPGDTPIEKLQLLRQSLATLEATQIGHDLCTEVGDKLRAARPRQWNLHFSLVKGEDVAAVCSDAAHLTIRMDPNLDPNSLAMQHTFLTQNPYETLDFFQVVYPHSVTLGHELGHTTYR